MNRFVARASEVVVVIVACGTLSVPTASATGAAELIPLPAGTLKTPSDVILDTRNDPDEVNAVLVADRGRHQVLRVTRAGQVEVVVGDGTPCANSLSRCGDVDEGAGNDESGLATAAQLNQPSGLSITSNGTLLIADSMNSRIREVYRVVGSDGVARYKIRTVAGTGESNHGADGVSATASDLDTPFSVVAARDGFYVAEPECIRFVDRGGVITTVAGGGNLKPSIGLTWGRDAMFTVLNGLSLANDGSLLIADNGVNKLLRFSWEHRANLDLLAPRQTEKIVGESRIEVIAGSGQQSLSGDGGSAVSAALSSPTKAVQAPDGSIYVVDHGNSRIRRIDRAGNISTIFGGDSGVAVHGAQAAGTGTSTHGALATDSSTHGSQAAGPAVQAPISIAVVGSEGFYLTDAHTASLYWVSLKAQEHGQHALDEHHQSTHQAQPAQSQRARTDYDIKLVLPKRSLRARATRSVVLPFSVNWRANVKMVVRSLSRDRRGRVRAQIVRRRSVSFRDGGASCQLGLGSFKRGRYRVDIEVTTPIGERLTRRVPLTVGR